MPSKSIYRNKFTASIALVALLGTFLSPPALHATGQATWWVSATGTPASTASAGTSCDNPSYVGNTAASIQAAINGAAPGDEVSICSGYYAINNTVIIDLDITLGGVGEKLPVLDGGGTTRIMSISDAWTVSIKELLFQNGMVDATNADGAALQAHPSSNLTVIDSLFVNNVAKWHGGAVSMAGEGNGSLSVLRSTFYKNRAEDGGAILMVGSGRLANVTNSTFVSNVATRDGGAIGGSFANVTASSSTFVDNQAAGSGAAIYNVATSGNIFADTTASSSVVPCAGERPHAMNVSTHSSCLIDSQDVVTYESLRLKFLGTWGARVPTMPIDDASSAIDAVTNTTNCAGSDQFGATRTSPCDAGATEHRANLPTISTDVPTIAMMKGIAINADNNFTHTGLTNPVQYRITTELNPLDGVTMSSAGALSGSPTSSYRDSYFVITGTDVNGVKASGLINVDNCILPRQNEKFSIETANHLEIFRIGACGLDAEYLQTADVVWNGTWNGPTLPTSPFTGTYDGGNHSVSGLQISGGRTGFIAHTNGATISNLKFGATVSGSYGTAGLVYSAKATTIDNVHGSGYVSTPINDLDQGCIGGLVGEAETGTTIINSSYAGTIDAANGNWNGGLIGCAYAGAQLERSYFKGTVHGLSNVGGLVGWMEFTDIRDSYAIGSVLGTGNENGGLVGWLTSDNSTDNDDFAIQNSFSSVVLTGNSPIGALLGVGHSTSISSTFWQEGQTGVTGLNGIGQLTDTEGEQPNLNAFSATDMKNYSLFADAGWSIGNGWSDATARSTVWAMCDEEDRPFLFWQYSSTNCEQFTTPTPEPDTPPADTPTPPSSDPAPTTDTTSPSTTIPVSAKADSVSATDANTTTTSTVISPTTPSSTQSVAPTVAVGPKLTTGGVAIFSNGIPITKSLKWFGNSTISGTIGKVKFALKFNEGRVQLNTPATLVAGSTFKLTLHGLKPGSNVKVTLFSQPTSLGTFKTSPSGTIDALVGVPTSVLLGAHRLRVELVDQNNQEVAVWTGIKVTTDIAELPSTGTSSTPAIFVALWTLIAGCALLFRKWTSSTL
jgi:LPXTG-motif cell wall-anchored protein